MLVLVRTQPSSVRSHADLPDDSDWRHPPGARNALRPNDSPARRLVANGGILGERQLGSDTLIAGTSVSLLTDASLEGRALNQGAAAEAITLDSCTITVPTP